ncbi:MAG: HXXEE domain-containing protein [Bacteroidetes bacterium]|nr:HXXEE domain-containing protein [Bacteroidota bacterium]
MNFLRRHWFDLGGILGIITLFMVIYFYAELSNYELLMWLSLTSLFFHQLEEYRIAGTFPGMINGVMFKSDLPDRYPLNSNTSLIINVGLGWTIYLLAAFMGPHFVWLGLASIIVSLGNIIAHTFIFNFKGKTIYNAGLATCWLFFAPCVFFFFKILHNENIGSVTDYIIGILLGIFINIVGILKLIIWLADKNTKFIFSKNQLLARDRKM